MLINAVKLISEGLSCTLYLYSKEDSTLYVFTQGSEKKTTLPNFLADMNEKKQFRRVVEKDGLKSVYHRFSLDDNFTVFFQDKLDDSMLAEFIRTSYETKLVNDTWIPESEDNSGEDYKRDLINAKTEQVKLRQEIRQRESLNNQFRVKLEYLANDLVMAQKVLRDQNDIITTLKARTEEYYSIIKKMNSTTERTNLNKLKNVTEQLRQELTRAHFNARTADDTAEKLRRNSSLAFQEASRVIKNDSISKTDIMKILNYLLINESLGRNNSITIDESKIIGNELDIKKTIIALNNAIRYNDISTINQERLADIVPLNLEEAKSNPKLVIEAIGNTLNLVKARKLTQKQIELLTYVVSD